MMDITVKDTMVEKIPQVPLSDTDIVCIKMASMSPYSNGIVQFVEKNGIKIGWLEKYNPSPMIEKGTPDIFRIICRHNSYLSWYGYVDLDVNPCNFFADTLQTCDKGGVMSIPELDITMVCKFFVGMALYYDVRLIEKVMPLIAPSLFSKNAKLISKTFDLVDKKLDGFT